MNLKYLFIVIALVFIGCSKEKTADSVINNYIKNTSNKNAVTYDVSYKIKYFDAVNDTVKYNSNCRLIRHENDTIFGKTFWIKNDSIDRYYDLKLLYIINHKKKEITRFFPHEGQTFPITGNTINGVIAMAGIVIALVNFIDVLFNKNRKSDTTKKQVGWFYDNEKYTRELDERADRNQYKIK